MTDQTQRTRKEQYVFLAEKHANTPGALAEAYVEIGRLQARVNALEAALKEIRDDTTSFKPSTLDATNLDRLSYKLGQIARKALKGDMQ